MGKVRIPGRHVTTNGSENSANHVAPRVKIDNGRSNLDLHLRRGMVSAILTPVRGDVSSWDPDFARRKMARLLQVYPCRKRDRQTRSLPVSSIYTTDFVIDGYGSVPIVNGDPKWLPAKVKYFIGAQVKLMRPAAVHICNGSFGEAEYLSSALVDQGVMEKLTNYDNVFVARTDPLDAMERITFICSAEKNYAEKKYVIPFCLGPIGGRYSINAIQVTDSAYVVLSTRIIARVSSSIWDAIGQADFVRCVHSIGRPRPLTSPPLSNWACNIERYFLAHRLEENDVWAFGSAFGQNSLLSKKCVSLRLAIYRGLKEGWLVLQAAVIAVKDPSGKELFGCVSFPTGSGKTQFATMTSALPGWEVRVLGDDVAWIRCSPCGRLYALPPENGIFGCASGINPQNNKNLLKLISKDSLLLNCASTNKGRFYWEVLKSALVEGEFVRDWRNENWSVEDKRSPNHLNCRFSAFTNAAPNVHPDWEKSDGVPINFIIFGCKRNDKMPLLYETESWEHGVIMAAGIRTLPCNNLDLPGNMLVHDPFCMRTFMSVSFTDLIKHWLDVKERMCAYDKEGKFLWPGYGENIRILEWIFHRCIDPKKAKAISSAIGYIPDNFNAEGLNVDCSALFGIEKHFWMKEIAKIYSFFCKEVECQKLPIIKTVLSNIIRRVSALK